MAMVVTNCWGPKTGITRIVLTAPTAAGVTNVSLSGIVPVGTKAVSLYVRVTDATINTTLSIEKTGTGILDWRVRAQVANQVCDMTGDIELDANLSFDVENSAVFDSVLIQLIGLYL
jgi:hypothetical protein